MAGRPKRKAMIAELERRAINESDEERTVTPLELVEEWVASGKTILALAEDISKAIGQQISREMLSKYVNGLGASDGEGEARIARARARGAFGLVEQALATAEAPGETKEEIAASKLAIDTRLWVAQRFNRAELGEHKQTNVAISFGSLHLQALRHRASAVATLAPGQATVTELLPSPVEVVAEVVEE